jgi:TonB family protein
MSKKINPLLLAALFAATGVVVSTAAQGTVASLDKAPAASANISSGADTDRARDGLAGPVRRVRTEVAKISNKAGKSAEGAHALLEESAYDLKGAKTETAYYPVTGATLTGKETYKYDDKGNISEMTLLNASGSLLSKETYTYEFDFAGNWTKMTTSVAVIEGGKLNFEETEVTYRSISYYLDQNMLKMAQPAPSVTVVKAAQPTPQATTNAKTLALPSTNIAALGKSSAEVPNNIPAAPGVNASSAPSTGKANATGEAPPPAPVKLMPKPLMRPITGGVLNGSAISLPTPIYPDMAKRAHTTGIVTVEVVIDEQGKVISARAASGSPMLQQSAVMAARQAKFAPTTLSGQPVKVAGTINYNFKLAN